MFDPLFNGATVGQVVGPATFSSEGVRLDSTLSYVRYVIPQTITSGEFAMEIRGLRANATGDKSKVFGMMQGSLDSNDYITNLYRVDVQYPAALAASRRTPSPTACSTGWPTTCRSATSRPPTSASSR